AGGWTCHRERLTGDLKFQFRAFATVSGEGQLEIVHSPACWLVLPTHRIARIGPEPDPMITRLRFELGMRALNFCVECRENDTAIGERRGLLGGVHEDGCGRI